MKTMPDSRPGEAGQMPTRNEAMSVVQPGRSDLSDWVELMEAVDALCPVWPAAPLGMHDDFRL